LSGLHEIVSGEGRLSVCKTHLDWRRDRVVTVRDAAGGLLACRSFPAGSARLSIDGLPPGCPCRVDVAHADLIRRWLTRAESYQITATPRRLRVVIAGSGRCGTQSLARFLDGLVFRDGTPCNARHETLWEHVLPCLEAGDEASLVQFLQGFQHEVEAAPHFALVPRLLDADTVVHLVRDGRRVVQSGLNRGWYAKVSPWNAIKPDFGGDVFTNCCRFWAHTVDNMDGVADRTVRLEDLSATQTAVASLVADLGLEPTARAFPRENAGRLSSAADGWTARQREIFAECCGAQMDRHYPGWRD
jgi:hypothetical protein